MNDETNLNEFLPKRNFKSVEIGKSLNKENSVFLGEENLANVQNFQKYFFLFNKLKNEINIIFLIEYFFILFNIIKTQNFSNSQTDNI